MANYDEDLYDNPFFLTIHKQFSVLFNKAVAEKALVCVPKYASCSQHKVTEDDVKDHVLFLDSAGEEEEEEEKGEGSLYKTISQKAVLIKDGKLHTKDGFEHQQSVRLLFEETFHSENDNSYRVLCVDHFLNHLPVLDSKESVTKPNRPNSYDQCLDLLWNHSGGKKTRDNLDKMLTAFGDIYNTLEGGNLRGVVDMASAQFTKAMQLMLKDSVVRRSVKHNPPYMDNLKVAVETYLMNAIHVRLFRVVTALMADEDSEINKMTRNLTSLQLQDIGIRKIFSQNIPPAKKELAGLNRYSTPMGRLFCVKRVVTALTRPLRHAGQTDESTALMTTDDFLPILIFLIIKSEIPNWWANLVYMRHFHLAKCTDDDEFGFYLASVEAALEHIKSGYISEDIKVNKPKREGWAFLDLSPGQSDAASESSEMQGQDSSSVIDEFFRNVQNGSEEAVRQMLQKPQRSSEEIHLKLCHPLCSCDKCDKILSASRTDHNLVTAFTRDNRGYTALHMAAYYGQGKLIDLLTYSGAVVDATDYLGLTPLHLACLRGYQNVMLLLLHFEADVMAKDNEGNTPLHHCCVNGHDDCVKALVFYDGSVRKLQVNAVNELGDTALHLAAKWGYEVIVKTLIENGANATIKNRKQQSPVHVAQNIKVQRILQSSTEGLELRPLSFASVAVGSSTQKKGSRSSSSSSTVSSGEARVRQDSLWGQVGGDLEDWTSGRVETASLDEAQHTELSKRKEKVFRAIMAGDIQLVKFYMGIEEGGADPGSDEDDSASSASTPESLSDMCHPLCQCHKCQAIQKAQVKARQSLSVNVKTASGYTPLHMAVLHGHDDMVHLFLQRGACINCQNHKNFTPLHIAACMRKLLTMQLLVEGGARLSVRDINGDTPLLICSACGFCEGVRLIVERGGDVNVINYRGNTALHEAANHSHSSIVLTLLQAGADPTIRNRQTKTAANMAKVPQIEKELQRAVKDWESRQLKGAVETRPKNQYQPVVGNSQISVRELFAAFEEEDLKTVQTLTSAIRAFKKDGSLRKAVTRDNSRSLLESLSHRHSICTFDSSSLKRIKIQDRSRPLYIYSLGAEGGDGQGGREEEEGVPGERAEGCAIRKSQSDILVRWQPDVDETQAHCHDRLEEKSPKEQVPGPLDAEPSQHVSQLAAVEQESKSPKFVRVPVSQQESQIPGVSEVKAEHATESLSQCSETKVPVSQQESQIPGVSEVKAEHTSETLSPCSEAEVPVSQQESQIPGVSEVKAERATESLSQCSETEVPVLQQRSQIPGVSEVKAERTSESLSQCSETEAPACVKPISQVTEF